MSPDRACEILNEAFSADPQAIESLLSVRIPCNRSLADHPSIVVSGPDIDRTFVGILGLINGMVGSSERAIAAKYSDECPHSLVGFEIVKPVFRDQ